MDHRGSLNSDENIHTVGAGGGSSNNNGTGLDRDLGAAPGVAHYAFSSSKRDFLTPDPFSPLPPPHRNGAVTAPPAPEASPDPSPRSAPARYRECLRNHAASVGGLVVDGCGEFLSADSDALKCSVCGCHRSFHRRETEPGEAAAAAATMARHAAPPPYYYHHYSLSNGGGRRAHGGGGGVGARLRPGTAPPPLLALPPPQSRPQPLKPSPIMSFRGVVGGNESSGGAGGGSDTDSSSEEMDAYTPVTPAPAHPAPWTQPPPISSRKRFRTKFTAEQKERMLEFAGALGWRMLRRDEGAVDRFCAEVGVPRKVFKVWMHNNKHASTTKPLPPQQHQIHPPTADPFSRPLQQQQPLPHGDTYIRPPPPPQQHAQADAYSRPHADTYARPHPPSSPP